MKKRGKGLKIILGIFVGTIIIVCALLFIQYYNGKKNVEDIEKIDIIRGGYLSKTSKYIIDFNTNKVYYEIQEKEAVCTYSKNFNEDKKEYFISKANLYGMFRWKEVYEPNKEVYDGRYTEIYITYTDGSYQEILCYNDYPLTYNKMKSVLNDAFGYDML